ncbi:MAG: PEP-CTERM sorting domain-containing protein [Armatimonadetes bacterium]|nr:PEP-CTERM sorting domain-containing protein [Armatimonadota bacterium]
MIRVIIGSLTLAASFPGLAFYDHFEGDELGDYWYLQTEWEQAEYNVGDSWLNVTRVYFPGEPGNPNNLMTWTALTDPQGNWLTDLDLRAIVAWGDGADNQLYIGFDQSGYFPAWQLGFMAYRANPGESPTISAYFRGGQQLYFEAPPPGVHEFRMQRIGNVGRAWIDGELIYEHMGVSIEAAEWVTMGFGGADGRDYRPLSVDLIEMHAIPEPATILGLVTGVGALALRTRSRR